MVADTHFLIDSQVLRIRGDFGLTPVTASEIEFYMPGATASGNLPAFWEDLIQACAEAGIRIYSRGPESGADQFEIALAPSPDAKQVVRHTQTLKSLIAQKAETCGFTATFAAKPFPDQPGSGLHMHVSLADASGKNTFFKNDYEISPQLKHSIGGLVAWVADCMAVFAPNPESYARLTPKSNAPVTASWGANNRTTAVRLPDAPHDDKHIELRVSGSDADPGMVMVILLAAVHYGLKYQSDPGQQVYGDASLPSYNLPRLPSTLEEATARLQKSQLILEYFTAATLLA